MKASIVIRVPLCTAYNDRLLYVTIEIGEMCVAFYTFEWHGVINMSCQTAMYADRIGSEMDESPSPTRIVTSIASRVASKECTVICLGSCFTLIDIIRTAYLTRHLSVKGLQNTKLDSQGDLGILPL